MTLLSAAATALGTLAATLATLGLRLTLSRSLIFLVLGLCRRMILRCGRVRNRGGSGTGTLRMVLFLSGRLRSHILLDDMGLRINRRLFNRRYVFNGRWLLDRRNLMLHRCGFLSGDTRIFRRFNLVPMQGR